MELEGGQLITVVFILQDKGIAMYQTILQECRKWFYNVSSQYDEVLKISIEKDDSSCLIGDIDSNRYISQIIVAESGFKPYRYVEFTIYDLDKDVNQSPVFWYGDQDNSSVVDIIDNLNKGLRIVLS